MADEPVQPDPKEELPSEPAADEQPSPSPPLDEAPSPVAPAAQPQPVDAEEPAQEPVAAKEDVPAEEPVAAGAETPAPPAAGPAASGASPARMGNSIDQSELDALAEELARVEGAQAQRKARTAPKKNEIDPNELDALAQQLADAAPTPPVAGAAPEESEDLMAAMAAEIAAQQESGKDFTEPPAVMGHTPVTVQPEEATEFQAPELSADAAADLTTIDMLDDVQLDVKIELGRTHMQIEDVLRLGPGSVVELDKLAGDPVDIFVNERLIARGEVLVLNDNFCVRINDIHSPIPELDEG